MRLIDIAGLIYNHCIALHKRYYRLYHKHINKYRLSRHITKLKRTNRFSFIRKLDAQAVENILFRIDWSYNLFWHNIKHHIKASPPTFKLRKNNWKLNEEECVIIIHKIPYRYIKSRDIEGKIKTVTIKRDSLGDIYIYIVCEIEAQEVLPRTGKIVGYDFGLKKFLTASDGNDIESPMFFSRNAQTINRLNRILSHKKKGSKRRKRACRELARAYKRAADQSRDFHYKTARKICKDYAVVCAETLNIKGMARL